MTLPVNNTSNVSEDDSDMFGPPHSSPPIRRNRPKIPMISAQLRLREVRKRILQLCVHKLERIKDSERNLRRSVCINNTYSRLTDDIRREKQNKYLLLTNLSKSDSTKKSTNSDNLNNNNNNNENLNNNSQQVSNNNKLNSNNNNNIKKKSTSVETDLETLDRELCALDAAMPLVDPEITQGAEQLEQAMVSRKRKLSQMEEEDNDRLVREALSQFYLPSNRLLSGIDDCPVSSSPSHSPLNLDNKRPKLDLLDQHHPFHHVELNNLDLNQNQKEFEVIMDALRIGAAASNNLNANCVGNIDSCGQAAMMMSGDNGGVFHNLVVTSLET